METTASRKRSTETSTSCQRRNMERPGRPGEDVDSLPLARLPRTHGRDPSDGHRRIHGHHRLLLKRLRNRRIPQQHCGEGEDRAARAAPQQSLLHGPYHYGRGG